MDLIKRRDEFNISDKTWKVYYRHEGKLPQFIGDSAQVTRFNDCRWDDLA